MSNVLGSAEFVIKVRDEISGVIGKVGGKVRGLMTGVASSIKDTVVHAAGNLLSGAIERSIAKVKDFVSQGLAANSQFDQLNNTFTSMLGSQRKAAALMKDITKFAADTPFEMQGLTKNVAALLATRQVGQNDVIPMLKKLGDAAAGSTEGFEAMPRIVRAVSQMLSKGKLQAEEMMQLAEAGVPAWAILADKMKMTSGEVQALGQKGKLGIREIMLLVDGLGERYKGLADKQSKTFAGLASTIADNTTMALAKITRPIYEKLTKMMQRRVDFMNSAQFAKIIDKITETVAAAVRGVEQIEAAAVSLYQKIQVAFHSPAAVQFKALLRDIWFLTKEIAANISDNLLPVITAIGAALRAVFAGEAGGIGGMFKASFAAASAVLKTFLDDLSILTTSFSKTWDFLILSGAAAIFDISDRFQYLFGTQIPHWISAIAAGFIAGGATIVSAWQEMFQKLANFLGDLFSTVLGGIAKQIEHLAAANMAILHGDAAGALAAVNRSVAAGIDTKNAVAGKAGAFAGDVAGAAAKMAGGIGGQIANAMNGVMKNMPAFKPGAMTDMANKQANALWEEMRRGRNAKRNERFMDGLGIDKIPGKIGGFLGDMFAKGGNGFFGGVEDFLGIFGKKAGVDAEKKKAQKSEFVGFADMNKRIQGMLGKEDKNAKAQLKAVQQGAKAAEKGAAAGEAIVGAVGAVKEAIGKIVLGFAP